MKNCYLAAMAALFLFLFSCKKSTDNCAEIQQVRIVVEKDTFQVGEEINIKVNQLPSIALFDWRHGTNSNSISGNEYVYINYADKGDEGWYYLTVSYPDCETHYDSVHITVMNKPATAPCTSTNNVVTFSSIPSISPATVTWSYNNSWNRRTLAASGSYGYPELNIYFNTYWDNKEPEDGEYSITDMSSTGQYPVYTVYLSALYSSVFFQASSGKVYVSHINGKLRVTFCGITFSGDLGGSSVKTTATTTLTAP